MIILLCICLYTPRQVLCTLCVIVPLHIIVGLLLHILTVYAVSLVFLMTSKEDSDSTHESFKITKSICLLCVKDWHMKSPAFTKKNILYLTLPV